MLKAKREKTIALTERLLRCRPKVMYTSFIKGVVILPFTGLSANKS
jgi:hypothetical protein